MPTTVEGTHQVGDKELFTKSWKTDETPKAKLIFIHGFNDHIDRYYDLFPTLASRGIEVHGFDQRGWGRSVQKPADKGLTGPTTQVISDIVSFIKKHLPSEVPVFVMGHSMGGGQALMLASDPQYEDLMPSIRGWLLESPYIGLPAASKPAALTVFVGRLAGKFMPHKTRVSALLAETLTRDPEVVKSLKEDKLLHDTGTLEGLAGMLDRGNQLNNGKTKLNKGIKSLWCGHGTDDNGTCYDASERYMKRQTQVLDKEFKTYDGWSHQLHADQPDNRHIFANDVAEWILARLSPEDAHAASTSKL